jgi:chemotaxis protein methyltransferase CheR
VKPGIEALAELVHRESGIVVRTAQFDALEAALERAHPGTGAAEFVRLSGSPATVPNLVPRLLDEATVKETFFLRDAEQLECISWPALLERAQRDGADRVRVWSAACATGEEAYSLALLACQSFGTAHPRVTIVATDISGDALARARRGEYGRRSVRLLDDAQRARFFREDGDRLVVGEALRALVTFAPHNLVLDPSPPRGQAPFHLILCRNVLIYFDAETVDRVIASLERALTRSGTVILGAADALCGGAARLRALTAGGAVDPPRAPARGGSLRRPFGHPMPAYASSTDPGSAVACLLQGFAEIESGDAPAAIVSLRRALYLDPDLGLAAFQLGRAHEALADRRAAQRAYRQALRTLERDGVDRGLQESLLGQVNLEDIIRAVHMRLDALSAVGHGEASSPRR